MSILDVLHRIVQEVVITDACTPSVGGILCDPMFYCLCFLPFRRDAPGGYGERMDASPVFSVQEM